MYPHNAIIPFKAQVIAIFLISMVLLFVVRCIRQGKLREEFSFVWFFVIFIAFVFTIWVKGLVWITCLLGVNDANSTIFFFGMAFLIMLSLYLTVILSKLKVDNKNMAQEIALLKLQIGRISAQPESGRADGDSR